MIAKRTPFDGGFGVFDDYFPDGWGNLICDRFLKSRGINPNELNVLQKLAWVGTGGRGSLEYNPHLSKTHNEEMLNFDLLAKDASALLTSEMTTQGIKNLTQYHVVRQVEHVQKYVQKWGNRSGWSSSNPLQILPMYER